MCSERERGSSRCRGREGSSTKARWALPCSLNPRGRSRGAQQAARVCRQPTQEHQVAADTARPPRWQRPPDPPPRSLPRPPPSILAPSPPGPSVPQAPRVQSPAGAGPTAPGSPGPALQRARSPTEPRSEPTQRPPSFRPAPARPGAGGGVRFGGALSPLPRPAASENRH